jgi:hypothetical protein
MSPVDARTLQLCAELERDWEAVRLHLSRAESLDAAESAPNAAFVALALHHAYEAFETLLLRIEKALSLRARQGTDWHVAILSDAAAPLPGVRPPVIPAEVFGDWLEQLKFRHFLRHAYVANLDGTRLLEVRARLRRAVDGTGVLVNQFLGRLRAG